MCKQNGQNNNKNEKEKYLRQISPVKGGDDERERKRERERERTRERERKRERERVPAMDAPGVLLIATYRK